MPEVPPPPACRRVWRHACRRVWRHWSVREKGDLLTALFRARLRVLSGLSIRFDPQFPRGPQCASQDILIRRGQANMSMSHFSPPAGNRQEDPGRLLDKCRLLFERQGEIAIALR